MADFKKLSRGLVLGLVVVVGLVSYNLDFPAGNTSASNWKFAFTHPTIALHIIMASVVLVAAAIMLIKSIRAGSAMWIALSISGMAFLILAYVYGEDYVVTLGKGALNFMSIGWVGAIVVYGMGWYLGRKDLRRANPAVKGEGP